MKPHPSLALLLGLLLFLNAEQQHWETKWTKDHTPVLWLTGLKWRQSAPALVWSPSQGTFSLCPYAPCSLLYPQLQLRLLLYPKWFYVSLVFVSSWDSCLFGLTGAWSAFCWFCVGAKVDCSEFIKFISFFFFFLRQLVSFGRRNFSLPFHWWF